MRLLGAVRLSKDSDETTSPARQRKVITKFAAEHGHTVVAVPEDLDVSGKVAPFDRPALGLWLKKPDEWDAVVVAKLDRLSRSLRDFANFQAWLAEHDKVLICLDPFIDFSTPYGKALAHVLMTFAELERELIAGRTRETHLFIKQGGGYPGGQVPFGYTVVQRPDGSGWEYVLDPVYAPAAREMAARVLGESAVHPGVPQSMSQVAKWLNHAGIPTARNVLRRRNGNAEDGGGWRVQQVRNVLTSPAITGLHYSKSRPLQDSDGMLVRRCEGIITEDQHRRVLAAITGPAHGAHRVDANPLLHVAWCPCGSTMSRSRGSKNRDRMYYRCGNPDCRERYIPAGLLEDSVEELFLEVAGDLDVMERIETAAENHAAEMAETEQAIELLDERHLAGELHIDAWQRMINKLQARRDKLAAMPSRPATTVLRSTGRKFSQAWADSTPQARRQLLVSAGFRVMVRRNKSDGGVFIMVVADAELAKRVKAVAAGDLGEPVPFAAGSASMHYPIRAQLYMPPVGPGVRLPETGWTAVPMSAVLDSIHKLESALEATQDALPNSDLASDKE